MDKHMYEFERGEKKMRMIALVDLPWVLDEESVIKEMAEGFQELCNAGIEPFDAMRIGTLSCDVELWQTKKNKDGSRHHTGYESVTIWMDVDTFKLYCRNSCDGKLEPLKEHWEKYRKYLEIFRKKINW